MLTEDDIAAIASTLKRVRIPASDVDAARSVKAPKPAKSCASRMFSAIGAAVLEKLCRHGEFVVRSRKTVPYVVDTPRGRIAISVMVSAIYGDPAVKNMVVPRTSLRAPGGVAGHAIVAAFVSKLERKRERNGGLETCLAGWLWSDEVAERAEPCRVHSRLSILTVPVRRLRPIDTLRECISNENGKEGQK